MKKLSIQASIAMVLSMSLFIFSCNSDGDTKTTQTTADTTAKATPPPPPPKPGNVMIIMHKVANFAKWKPEYENHDSVRKSYGLTNYILGRGMDDSNMVLVALKMDDETKAKELASSNGMKERMKKGGVLGVPTIEYIETVVMDNAANGPLRVRVTHKVKDWDAWKKAYDSTHQSRIDGGLMDRSVGHYMDDNHMVSVVCVITDLAKAKAFMNSPELKDLMTKAGVEGKPEVFFYNVAQSY